MYKLFHQKFAQHLFFQIEWAISNLFALKTLNFHHNVQNVYQVVHPEVLEALNALKPVVALESTIITHGMPYPQNFKTALEVESIVRKYGAIPATIAVINGKINVGLEYNILQQLASSINYHKISRRDLAMSLAKGYSGGTTVSATMLIAKWCGIKIFVTGGIGGVHKMGETTMDISNDLKELGENSMMVVCAGIKSILDIGRTLEYLETQGVTVASFGKSKEFPAFFKASSGYNSPFNVETVQEASLLLKIHDELQIDSSLLLGVPIPEEFSYLGHKIENSIDKALDESRALGISGKAVTPFVLKRVNELTNGLSLHANIQLIKNNARVGAEVASCYSNLKASMKVSSYNNELKTSVHLSSSNKQQMPVVIGGCNFDIISKSLNKLETGGGSNPAFVSQSVGGVGRNITEVLWRLNQNPYFLSAIGNDSVGKTILQQFNKLETTGIICIKNESTSVYNAIVEPNGEVFVGLADSNVHKYISPELMMKNQDYLKNASLICVDGNISEDTMKYICSFGSKYGKSILFEPTDSKKAGKLFLAAKLYDKSIQYMTPSLMELEVIFKALTGKNLSSVCNRKVTRESCRDILKSVAEMCNDLLLITPCIIVTLGQLGVFTAQFKNEASAFMHYPISPCPPWDWLKEPIANVSGSGDSFAGGFIYGLLRHNGNVDRAVRIGITVAQRTLRSHQSVSSSITEADLIINSSDWKGIDIKF